MAIKTWHTPALAAYAARLLADIAPALPALCDPQTGVSPPHTLRHASMVMPVCAPVTSAHATDIVRLVARLLDPGGLGRLSTVHTDIKPLNCGVYNGKVVLLDIESFSRAPGPYCAIGSFCPLLWYMWHPLPPTCQKSSDLEQLRVSHPSEYDNFYYSCIDDICAILNTDPLGMRAMTRYGALASAISLRTGHSNPTVTPVRVARLESPDATQMHAAMIADWQDSQIKAAAAARGAALI